MDDEGGNATWQRQLDAGRAAWPTIHVEPSRFRAFLEERAAVAKDAHAADLYLVCACLHAASGALEAFETLLRSAARGPAQRIGGDPGFNDDVLQVLREKLLVATPTRRAGIADYEGRAALRTWLATAAARSALNLRRAARDAPHDELRSDVRGREISAGGAETRYAKEQHRRAFHEALRAALDTLAPRDRELLALHLVDGISLDALAERTGKGRATIARWLAAARRTLLEETKQRFCQRLGVPEAEYADAAAFVRSQLGGSVVELLKVHTA